MRTLALLALSGLAIQAEAQLTRRVSLSSSGEQGTGHSSASSFSLSASGRFVAFPSWATNLVPGDQNGFLDVFLHDRWSGTTELVSLGPAGVQADGPSGAPAPSADGRFVAFHSDASNLVAGDSNGWMDVFVRDRLTGTTEIVSTSSPTVGGDGDAGFPSLSADGRLVAFYSHSSNLVPNDTNAAPDVFVHDRQSGTTVCVSVAAGGAQAPAGGLSPAISGDGRWVAFSSASPNLVPGDTNGKVDVFVRDLQSGTTEIASLANGGALGNSHSDQPSLSADGRFVAFASLATNLVAGASNGTFQVYVRDRQTATTTVASLSSSGTLAAGACEAPRISDDGRFVVFESLASNLVPEQDNLFYPDVFVRDRVAQSTALVSISTLGQASSLGGRFPSLSSDGRYVSFSAGGNDLVAGDTNGADDTFVRDLASDGFSSWCSPGLSGVISCPCANPPAGANRGCENSASSGGAVLSASGDAYLTADSLVFATSGELPTATSIVMQGTSSVDAGLTFGQGVRCVGGSLKRLYVKAASAGSIVAPDLPGGDPTVSARSASLGDPIQAGGTRWYLVYYRDPVVLGGCPPASTFNATQTGRVDWSL